MRILTLFLLLSTTAIGNLNIQYWTTPEGAKVLFAQTKGLPMLDIALNFDAAASRDGDQFGLATLTNSLIGTATRFHNEEQIINAFESQGTQVSQSSLKDMAIITMRALTRNEALKKSLDMFTEVVTQPKFEQKYLTREKKQTLRSIDAGKQSPATVAANAFNKAVFGKHPYAHEKIGTKDSIERITIEDIKHHFRKYYVAKNLTIAIVGDVTKVKAKQIARQISHGLNMGNKPPINSDVEPLTKSQVKHIEFPSKQTHLLIGQVGINRAHSDYYPLYLGNHIFGGSGLTSILSNEIREKKGLAYSAVSGFTKMKSNGYFLLKLQTKNNQVNEAKDIAIKTFNKFIRNPVSTEKLKDGKDNIIGGFSLETASNANILTYLSIIGFYNLPLDYLSSFTAKIKDISAKDIQLAFTRLFDMNNLVVLSVGQSK